MTIGMAAIIDAVASNAAKLALFDQVNMHEPKNAVGSHLSCSIWVDKVIPSRENSGLNSVSVVMTLNVRLYTSMLQQPYDYIDIDLVNAADTLMAAYAGNFTLGGLVREVDLLGSFGNSELALNAGYLEQDKKLFRVMTITLPLVVSDVWTEAP